MGALPWKVKGITLDRVPNTPCLGLGEKRGGEVQPRDIGVWNGPLKSEGDISRTAGYVQYFPGMGAANSLHEASAPKPIQAKAEEAIVEVVVRGEVVKQRTDF